MIASRLFIDAVTTIDEQWLAMHPVTAHGYNLGLSGQEILAKEIVNAASSGRDIGAAVLLQRFQRRHRRAAAPMFHGTNEIVKFFTDDRAPARLARTVALRLANRIPPIKRIIQNKLTEAGPAFS